MSELSKLWSEKGLTKEGVKQLTKMKKEVEVEKKTKDKYFLKLMTELESHASDTQYKAIVRKVYEGFMP